MPPLSIEDAIAAAEREINKLTDDYPRHLLAALDEVENAAKASQWDKICVMAHDIKGQAATLGWPVIGEMAHSLKESLGTQARSLFAEVVRLHLASLRFCLHHQLCTADREAARLLGDLRTLTDTMRTDRREKSTAGT